MWSALVKLWVIKTDAVIGVLRIVLVSIVSQEFLICFGKQTKTRGAGG